MEVTKANFQELLPEIEETIKNSDFLCVDGEFTGLNYGSNITCFDLPKEYYSKLHTGAMDFLFIQFGLAAFTEVKETESYDCRVYNFYVFPKPLNRSAPDCRFLCQSSSLDFLASQGFDFNKLFTSGIPYLTQSDEVSLKETLAERRRFQMANSSTPIPIPKQYKQQVGKACNRIKELLSPECTKEEIIIEKCSGFVRKLIYQSVRNRFPLKNVKVETKNGVLIARKRDSSSPTPEDEEKEANEKERKELDEAVGFSKVIRAISASEKLVVGHNMLLDLCHMIHQFCDPLPEHYSDFKEMAHFIFPKVIDTKFMCSVEPLKELINSSVLENMLQTISEQPFSRPEINFDKDYGYKLGLAKYHEAGYDAYITGVCFLSFLKYLESRDKAGTGLSVLKPYINKLFLMRTPDTHINLEQSDPVPCRDHVFHVSFPKFWTNQNLSQLFSAYGSVQITWLNDSSAWVALFDRRESRKVMKTLCRGANLPKGVTVRTHESFTARPTSTNTGTAATHKRKSPEPVSNAPGKFQTVGNQKRRKTTIRLLGECLRMRKPLSLVFMLAFLCVVVARDDGSCWRYILNARHILKNITCFL